MSKKIIYLLSLLMALSLVFASCKKNPVGVQGNPNQEDNTIKDDTGGLQTSWDQIKDKTIMNNYPVIGESGGDYFRNPVVVALGEGNVLIVTEKRLNYPGSDNDIGVNGQNPVDIVYLLSSDAGDNFSSPAVVGESSANDGPNKAVSAPVVYYKRDNNIQNGNKVFIIASAGAGISRTGQDYSARTPKSKLKYIVGNVTFSEKKAVIDWTANGGWQDLDISQASIDKQYGTHSGRGVMNDGANIFVLPIITAEQGVNGNAKEMMGVTFVKVTVSGAKLSVDSSPVIGKAINFQQGSYPNFSKYKEAKPVDFNGSKVNYLVLPSPSSGNGLMAKGNDSSGDVPTDISGLKGSEGSFGFLKFTSSWYGIGEYNPTKYATDPSAAGGANGSSVGENAVLFSHVVSQTGANYLYMLDDASYAVKGGKSYQLAKTSKSSSIDVLPDGTVIIVAEKEKNTAAAGNKFNIFFSRYTQKFLAEQLQ